MEPRIKFTDVRWDADGTIDPSNRDKSISPNIFPSSQSPLPQTSAWNAGRTFDPLNRTEGISPRSVPVSQLPLPPCAPPEKPFQSPVKPQTSKLPRKKDPLKAEDKPILDDSGKAWDALNPENPIIGDMDSLHLWGSSNVRRIVDQNVGQSSWSPTQSLPLQPTSGYQYDFNSSPSGYENFVPNPALPPSQVHAGAGYLPRFQSVDLAHPFNYPNPNPSFNAPYVGYNTLAFPTWHYPVVRPTNLIRPSMGQHGTS